MGVRTVAKWGQFLTGGALSHRATMSDMRASAVYRLTAAANLLTRYFHDLAGTSVNVLEVAP